MPRIPKTNNARRERLAHIEQLLWWRGWVRRKDLTSTFGISPLQASHDLRDYRDKHPRMMRYDAKSARYVATANLKRNDGSIGDLEESARVLSLAPRAKGAGPWIGRVSLPARRAEPSVTRAVVQAIASGLALHIHYASIHSNTFRWRWITPHALGHDGWRWHVRAYCADHHDFRDFVLGRIMETGQTAPSVVKAEEDHAWSQKSTLLVRANPSLGAVQKRALELDFTMKAGRLEVTTSPALQHYTLAALGLTEDGHQKIALFSKENELTRPKNPNPAGKTPGDESPANSIRAF